jgi:L-aspartate oxidase
MQSDVLVIGSGIAGLSFALKAAAFCTVTLVTKKASADTATNLAQGGIAAVLSKGDSRDSHKNDTLKSGDGLCNKNVVDLVVDGGEARVRELVDIGVHFQKGKDGEEFDLGMEGGHSHRRVAHAFDLTGHEIERALLEKIAASPNVQVLENHLVIDLLIASKVTGTVQSEIDQQRDKCIGAYVLDRTTGGVDTVSSRITVLCTGGCGKVYLYTTNPDIATGDGMAMAYRAGANIANLEFVQFHPTCFFNRQAKNFLISEAVRGEGGILINEKGHPFMRSRDPRGDLATRDAVARGIDSEMKESGADCVFLDITHREADYVRHRFPTIYSTCKKYGVDITKEPIPVVPAAHYMCGGVQVDTWGETSVKNLLALGETACTGLHGANRLASNSLLEAVVFADRAAQWLQTNWSELKSSPFRDTSPWRNGAAVSIEENVLISHNWDQIRRLMWNYVGIVRSEKRLQLVRRRITPILIEIKEHFNDYLVTPDLIELRNLSVIADLIIRSAAHRKESRGLHYIVDYPDKDDIHYRQDTVLCKKDQGD